MQDGWQFWIDRGGTFTDVIARAPDGRLVTRKLLSDNPGMYADAAVAGMRRILAESEGLADAAPFPADRVEVIKLGTTVATNTLLTRTGAPTLLAITEGFADALRIGSQHRPRLFDLQIRLPEMLYSAVAEVPERIATDGRVIRTLDAATTRARLKDAYDAGLRAVAIVLMHGYRYTDHERAVAAIAAEIGFTQISVSHRVIPLIKLIGRGDTTVADAYLSPGLKRYTARLANDTAGARTLFMQSNGGLAPADQFHAKDAVLSGPAGGVIGAAETARAAGFSRIIGFDMGGTSTDVCHVGGDALERASETVVAGVRLRAPMLEVHTVAAGGGSILQFDGLRFRVGPESAGADPGPACYGKGGPLTVTDANLLLGRISPAFFPKVFGATGDQPLDHAVVAEKFAALARATGKPAKALASGFLALAVDNMARAIRKISVERGHDLAGYVLCSFGGAGGQHACAVADALGMSQVFSHPLAGVLSAYGIGNAALRAIRERTFECALSAHDEMTGALDPLEAEVRQALAGEGAITVERRVFLRYAGTDTALAVPFGPLEDMRAAFTAAHLRQFGFTDSKRDVSCEKVAVEAIAAPQVATTAELGPAGDGRPAATVTMTVDSEDRQVPLYRRDNLAPAQVIAGPAVIAEELATTVVDAGWQATVMAGGALLLQRVYSSRATPEVRDGTMFGKADPLQIEIFNNRFMSIAEQMGAVLQNTAQSVNIKERLDFSCAIFDGAGNLLANAPHMPVHLGSMGESVRAVIDRQRATWREGDVFVLNNPYAGGTHLPDVTVITPVFFGGKEPMFFTAARGHHADIGGITPGSMPPTSKTLDEEGVLLDNLVLVRGGVFQEDGMRAVLTSGPYPARSPEVNIADLKAQVAANAKGASELLRLITEKGEDAVAVYIGHVLDHAEEAVRRVIGRLRSGAFTVPMDDGGRIQVAVTVDHQSRSATVDFTGTSPQRPTNFNAPAAVCRAAVLYVFRTLIADEIPMNEGVLRPITLRIPEGAMLRPSYPAAVVAGNVETSQIMCDALYGALGVLAASAGTMNNFTFGNARYQYYETIAGGSGAGPDFDGASAVQTHMTNSRLTDPEVLEGRYPVRVERFTIRKGSGGKGKHKGGDGIVRTIRFETAMTAGILSGRRLTRPFGLDGGGDGAPGETTVQRKDATETLGATAETQVSPGDTITICSPGGGGYGKP